MRNIIISFGLSMFLTCIVSSDAYAVVSKAHRSNASKQMTVEKLHKSLTKSIAKLRKGYCSLSRTPKRVYYGVLQTAPFCPFFGPF